MLDVAPDRLGQTVVDTIAAIVVILDRDGKIVRFNRGAEDVLGYRESEVLGRAPWDFLIDYADRDEVRDAFRCMLREGLPTSSERLWITRTGERRLVRSHNVADLEDGAPAFVVVTGIDITEQRAAERELEALSEIGRIIGSSLRIEDIYEQFADLARQLISFDRLVISLADPERDEGCDAYVSGEELPGYRAGATYAYDASAAALFGEDPHAIVVDGAVIESMPGFKAAFTSASERGFRSAMVAPIVWQGNVIGSLNFRSKETDAFGSGELTLADQIAGQIAGAVASAQAYAALIDSRASAEASAEELAQRVRELGVLYSIAGSLHGGGHIEDIARDVANLIPSGMRHPNITGVRIAFDHVDCQTEGFSSSPWRLSSDIVVNEQTRGVVEVVYTESRPEADEGPFLWEERALLDHISGLLAGAIERSESEENLKLRGAAVEASIDGIIAINRKDEIVLANPAAARIFGFNAPADLAGTRMASLMPEQYRPAHLEGLRRLNDGEQARIIGRGAIELVGLRSDGSEMPLELTLNQLSGSGPAAYVAVLRDITERRESEQELRLRSAALGATADMVVITDSDGNIEYVNEAFTLETGYKLAEIEGQNPRIWNSGKQDPAFYRRMWSTIKSGRTWNGELINRRKNGTSFTEEMTITPVFDAAGLIANFVAIRRNITERKGLEKELLQLATTDSLTGLLNRHQFSVLIEQALRLARRRDGRGALVMLDLDDFKYVNDTYGHAAGDELIVCIASELKSRLRASDVVGRIGGDEFAVILHDVAAEDAVKTASELVERIAAVSLLIDGDSVSVGCSAGVTVFPNGDASADDLTAFADVALYSAKDEGRGRVVLYSDLENGRDTASALQESRMMILDALSEDRLLLHWQPIVSTADQAPLMHEVLVRLEDADGQLRYPDEFISQAETLRLIDQVDRRIFSLALARGRTLGNNGAPPRLAINLSARSINDEMAEFIVQEAHKVGFPLECLTIEITETAVLRAGNTVRGAMLRLADAGVSFAMDDFGSGATSLRNLELLPFTYMKLDGDYIRNLATRSRDRELVTGMARLAQTLRLRVIAEHVEDEAALQFLRETDIEYAQGYFTGRPEPMPEA